MNLADRVCVVTGGAGGIGAALARRFVAEGAGAVVITDLEKDRTAAAAEEIGCIGLACDVTDAQAVGSLVRRVLADHGRIDLFVSNAGASVDGGVDVQDGDWQRLWDLHVMAHVYAARAVLRPMIAAGGGYLLQTVSAAGLLASLTSLPYTVTKTASLALAEWLAITYRQANIRVSAVCPLVVDTPLAARFHLDGGTGPAMSPDEVAGAVVEGIRDERFLILPHPEVADFMDRKASDRDRWLAGMSRLFEHVTSETGADTFS
jgi:NAD(P)-dependent dehydrogenase (short-subunit alcohol dehydrogenase family)